MSNKRKTLSDDSFVREFVETNREPTRKVLRHGFVQALQMMNQLIDSIDRDLAEQALSYKKFISF